MNNRSLDASQTRRISSTQAYQGYSQQTPETTPYVFKDLINRCYTSIQHNHSIFVVSLETVMFGTFGTETSLAGNIKHVHRIIL